MIFTPLAPFKVAVEELDTEREPPVADTSVTGALIVTAPDGAEIVLPLIPVICINEGFVSSLRFTPLVTDTPFSPEIVVAVVLDTLVSPPVDDSVIGPEAADTDKGPATDCILTPVYPFRENELDAAFTATEPDVEDAERVIPVTAFILIEPD